MTTSTAAPRHGGAPDDIGPASLDPRSSAFLVPFGIGVVLVALAFFGIKSIESSTGPWAIQAAQRGLAGSGLPTTDRAALTLQIERLSKAVDAGTVDAQSAVGGVDGLLKDPLFQLLLLDDVRTTRLSGSALSDQAKAAGAADLATLMSYVDAGLVDGATAYKVLGPMGEAPTDGVPAELDEAQLTELLARAKREVDSVEPKKVKAATLTTHDAESLLGRYAERIDAIITGS